MVQSVRATFNLDLLPETPEGMAYNRYSWLAKHPEAIAGVLWIVSESQAISAGITPERFAALLAPNTSQAVKALLQEVEKHYVRCR